MKHASYKIGLALALSVFAASAATAQSAERAQRPRGAQQDGAFRRGPGGRGEGLLLKGINLTDEQKTRIKALRAEQMKEFAKNRPADGRKGEKGQKAEKGQRAQRDTTGMGARRAEMEKRREQHIASLRSILTAEQRTQLDKNLAEMKAHAPKRGEGRRERAEK